MKLSFTKQTVSNIFVFYLLSLYGFLYTHSLKTADTGTFMAGGLFYLIVIKFCDYDSGHNKSAKLDNWLGYSIFFWIMALDLFKFYIFCDILIVLFILCHNFFGWKDLKLWIFGILVKDKCTNCVFLLRFTLCLHFLSLSVHPGVQEDTCWVSRTIDNSKILFISLVMLGDFSVLLGILEYFRTKEEPINILS